MTAFTIIHMPKLTKSHANNTLNMRTNIPIMWHIVDAIGQIGYINTTTNGKITDALAIEIVA